MAAQNPPEFPAPKGRGADAYREHVRHRMVHPPEILYLYRDIKTARLILENQTLRFSCPLDFNDPFDCQWDTYWQLRTAEADQATQLAYRTAISDPESWPDDADPRLRAATAAVRTELSGADSRVSKEAVDRLLSDSAFTPSQDRDDKDVREHARSLAQSVRVLCLTEDPLSVLMWSHYGDKHRGVVLGFGSRALEEHWERPVEPVEYLEHAPEVLHLEQWAADLAYYGRVRDSSFHGFIRWAHFKHEAWKYEREWRCALLVGQDREGPVDHGWPHTALREIGFGCRADPIAVADLCFIVNVLYPHVCVWRARQDTNGLVVDGAFGRSSP